MTKRPLPHEAIKQQIFSDIGYGKPPKHSQFQKGQSGNPKGRPPKTKPILDQLPPPDGENAATMHRVMQELVRINEGGRIRKVRKAEALERQEEKMSITGQSVLLMRDFRKRLLAEDERKRQELEKYSIYWDSYITHFDAVAKAFHDKDQLLARWMPHTNDITLATGRHGRCRGALSVEEAKLLEGLRQWRDALIAQVAWEAAIISPAQRSRRATHDDTLSIGPHLIGLINSVFPQRIVTEGERYWDEVSILSIGSPGRQTGH